MVYPRRALERRRPGHGGSTLPAGSSMDAPVVARSKKTGRNGGRNHKDGKITILS